MSEKILVTGAAGFIGFHLSNRLSAEGYEVVGLDNINDYYDVNLKLARLEKAKSNKNYRFVKIDLTDRKNLFELFEKEKFDYVVNLAAQAGVRYSIENPYAYMDSNLNGFINILEACRNYPVKHLIYASSSSVYGGNKKIPFSVKDNVDHPLSLYAATKKSNELMAHTYSSLYGIPTTGLRFFTVYGPWGRPDMACFLFTKAILEDKPINVFNHGKMKRDFTFIDDIVEGIFRLTKHIPQAGVKDDASDSVNRNTEAPYRVYNIGNHNPVELMDFIGTIEKLLGKEAEKNLMDLQPGDVPATFADVDNLIKDVGFKPSTTIEEGLGKFVEWYKEFYKI